MRKLRPGIWLLVLTCLMTSVSQAEGQALLRKIVKKVNKLFSDKEYLSDFYLSEEGHIIGTDLSFLLDSFPSYPYQLLTDYVVGDYDLNLRTGKPRSERSLMQYQYRSVFEGKNEEKEVTVIDKGLEINPKLNFLLLVSSYGDFGVNEGAQVRFLQEFFNPNLPLPRDTLVATVHRVLSKWQKTHKVPIEQLGVVLDFYKFPVEQREQEVFIELLQRLKRGRYKIYLKLPLRLTQFPFQDERLLVQLRKSVDLFILRSYGLDAHETLNEQGCNTIVDLNGLDKTLEFLNERAKVRPREVVLEFPNWGGEQEDVNGNRLKARAPNGKIMERVRASDPSFSTHVIDSTTTFREKSYAVFDNKDIKFCYEDSLTLSYKMQWIQSKGLGGVAFLGLGYNYLNNEGNVSQYFWWPIAKQYGRQGSGLGWVIGGYFFFFASLGYLWSIVQYWQVRNILAKYRSQLWNHSMRFLLFFFFFLLCMDIIPRGPVGLFLCGIILGFFLLLRLVRKYTSKAKRYTKYRDKF